MLRCMTQKQDVVEVTKRVIKRRGRRITPTEVVTKDNENHEASSWMFLSDKWVSLPVYFFVTSSQLLVIIPYSSFFLLFSTQHQSRHCFVFFSSAFICRHFLTLTRCEERRRKKERRGQEKEDLAKEPGPSRLEERREGSVRMKVTLFRWERNFFSSLLFSPLCVVFWWASLFLVSSLERHCIKQLLYSSRAKLQEKCCIQVLIENLSLWRKEESLATVSIYFILQDILEFPSSFLFHWNRVTQTETLFFFLCFCRRLQESFSLTLYFLHLQIIFWYLHLFSSLLSQVGRKI